MIKVIEGKVFYRLETQLVEDYNLELGAFLKEKGVSNRALETKLDIDFRENVGEQIEFKTDKFKLIMTIKEEVVSLLFVCEMDSDEFASFIAGYFEPVKTEGKSK